MPRLQLLWIDLFQIQIFTRISQYVLDQLHLQIIHVPLLFHDMSLDCNFLVHGSNYKNWHKFIFSNRLSLWIIFPSSLILICRLCAYRSSEYFFRNVFRWQYLMPSMIIIIQYWITPINIDSSFVFPNLPHFYVA